MYVVQLMASPFFGGPERQMLGLTRHLPAQCETVFLTFGEGGRSRALIHEVHRHGVRGETLHHNFPHVLRSVAEIADRLKALRADLLCCSGYKPDLLGWAAARRLGIPVVLVSHGWTAATSKVRLYEKADRWVHRRADAVVAVSEAQADKVRAAGVPSERVVTIANAVDESAFAAPEPAYRERLLELFPTRPDRVVGAAGRLSPEKGFDVLIDAVAPLCAGGRELGVVIFGDGPERARLAQRIAQSGAQGRIVLAGYHADAARYFPHLDVGVLSSHTEGLPVVLMEMQAASVPVVATEVGGVGEVIVDGQTGLLVRDRAVAELRAGIERLLDDRALAERLARAGSERIRDHFNAGRQAEQYFELFTRLLRRPGSRVPAGAAS
jgi:glycosyltransferase involved in cell wall biosynthesis